MPTKKPTSNKAAAAADAAVAVQLAATPCDDLGDEILRPGGIVTVAEGNPVDFVFHYCNTPGRMIVRLGEASETAAVPLPLMNQIVPPPEPIDLRLPALPRGFFLLHWSFVPTNQTWQTKAEVVVNGIVRFRHYKSNDSANPSPTGFLFLEVN